MAESNAGQSLAEPSSSPGGGAASSDSPVLSSNAANGAAEAEEQIKTSGASAARSGSGGIRRTRTIVEPTKWEDLPPGDRGFWYYQPQADWIYQHKYSQILVAGLIGVNFLVNMVEKQVDPQEETDFQGLFRSIETFFNIAFGVELLLNMYSCWFWAFWKSNWNKFDFVVVVIGLCNTFQAPFPPELALLRNMRAFRVFRLFKRVESLNRIVVSLVKAVPGMVNACLIVILVMFIYAICAVDLFANHGRNCLEVDKGITSRGFCVGAEYFGTFGSAFYTLFQILIGDSWCEAIVRPLFDVADLPPNTGSTIEYIIIGVFFVSFVIINAFVLINVVVAVLLANMVPPPEDKDELVEADCFDDIVEDVKTLRTTVSSMQTEVAAVSAELNKGLESTRDEVREIMDRFSFLAQRLKDLQPTSTKGSL